MRNLWLDGRPCSYLVTKSGVKDHCRCPTANAKNVHLSAMTNIGQTGRSYVGQICHDYAAWLFGQGERARSGKQTDEIDETSDRGFHRIR